MANVFSSGATPLVKFALGKGKYAKTVFSVQPLEEIVRGMQSLPRDISTKYQLRALRKAAKPGQEALRTNVQGLGQVTGNLLASVSKVERKYTNNRARVPVGLIAVGFRRPSNALSQKGATPAFAGGTVLKGPNRGYHSHLVEYGTSSRTPGVRQRRSNRKRVILGGRIRTTVRRYNEITKPGARILSSFKTRGPFTGRGLYPIDFVSTGTVRGSPARHPLARAYRSSESTMKGILDSEMRKALVLAVNAYRKRIQGGGE